MQGLMAGIVAAISWEFLLGFWRRPRSAKAEKTAIWSGADEELATETNLRFGRELTQGRASPLRRAGFDSLAGGAGKDDWAIDGGTGRAARGFAGQGRIGKRG